MAGPHLDWALVTLPLLGPGLIRSGMAGLPAPGPRPELAVADSDGPGPDSRVRAAPLSPAVHPGSEAMPWCLRIPAQVAHVCRHEPLSPPARLPPRP